MKIPAEVNAFLNNWQITELEGEHTVQEPDEALQFLADRLRKVLLHYEKSISSALGELGLEVTPFNVFRLLAEDFVHTFSTQA